MNKIVMQDMVSTKHKAPLRDIMPLGKSAHATSHMPTSDIKTPPPILPPPPPSPPRTPQRRSPAPRRTVKPWLFFIIAIVCLGAIIYGLSLAYARATVTVIPSMIAIPINGSFTAYKNALGSTSLPYEVIQTKGELHQTVPASVGPIVQQSAQGTVVLYNEFSTASQKIIANTRLSNGNGLIYLTNAAAVIPGMTKGSNGTVAGSVSVGVTAADTGPSYNILPSDLTAQPSYGDFNIVAYKGTSKYAGFYARLDPSGAGITGGSSGHTTVVASSTLASASASLKQSLTANLVSQAQALVPDGYIMYDNAYSINYTNIAASTTSSTTADVGMSGIFYGALLKKTDLAEAIAPTQYSDSYDPEGLESADFAVTNPQPFSPASAASIVFTLKGTLNLVGTFSTTTLASQLAGIALNSSQSIFKGYSTISSAHATILPFWKRSFPSSPSRINIVIQKQ
jgi:hypothetical protein